MSGISGVINYSKLTKEKFIEGLSRNEKNATIVDQLFVSDDTMIARSHLGIYNSQMDSPITEDGISIWIDGEVFEDKKIGDYELFKRLVEDYREQKLAKNLGSYNGIFSIVIKDHANQKLLLISDRYGLRRMHYFKSRGMFAWSSDVKTLVQMEDITVNVSKEHLNCFLTLGHFIGTKTYFEEIDLLPPATIMTYSYDTGLISSQYYWTWF